KAGRKKGQLSHPRGLGEKLGSPRHQRRCDATRKVCLPTRLIREGVKDAERRRPKAEPKPRGRGRLFLYCRKTSAKEVLDLFLFSSFCFKPNEQCYADHFLSPVDNLCFSLSLEH